MDELTYSQKRRWVLVDLLQAGVLLCLVLALQMLSRRGALRLADFLGELVYKVWTRRARIARRNIQIAYGHEWSPAYIDAVARGAFRNLARTAVEAFMTPRLITARRWVEHVRLHPSTDEIVRLLIERKTPVLMVSGHYGNWEALGFTLAVQGFANYSIIRPLDNRFVNDMLTAARRRAGQRLLSKFGSGSEVLSILQAKGVVCVLADPNAGKKGVFVDFFGVKASVHKAVAAMCINDRVPIAVGVCRRLPGVFQFEVKAAPIIRPEEFDGMNRADAMTEVTRRFTRELEMLIREDPTQYMWTFRRFKARTRQELAVCDDPQRDREDDVLAGAAG
jgi:KDO2-lipid IV(A) lauroyltransferase